MLALGKNVLNVASLRGTLGEGKNSADCKEGKYNNVLVHFESLQVLFSVGNLDGDWMQFFILLTCIFS